MRIRQLLTGVLLAAAAALGHAQPTLTPAQAAWIKAENRNVEDRFVAEVARIVRTSPERVRTAMPDERRITAAATRLISALEKDLGALLEDEQKRAILDADERRKRELAQLRERAVQR
jgi:hypothetical protein